MDIFKILNSNFFIGLVTLLAGLTALIIYRKQKKDSKKDAANIILLEIQSAERTLGQIREPLRASTLPNKFLLPTDSWSKYKYLFVRDLDRDEWDTTTEFYNQCKLYDESVSYNNSQFQKNEEQLRVNMFRVHAEYVKECLDSESMNSSNPNNDERQKLLKEAYDKGLAFQNAYLANSDAMLYRPNKPIMDAKNYLESINTHISQASIGSKLKKIAGLKT